MDREEFRKAGYAAVDSVCDYFEGIEERIVFPAVQPGSVSSQISSSAPESGQPWSEIIADYEKIVLPATVAWAAPTFMAYFPANTTYESIIADILVGAVSNPGFNWAVSPAATELEVVVMDWVAKLFGLDDSFFNTSNVGGGIIMGSASESVLTIAVAAREKAVRILSTPTVDRTQLTSKFVILGTDQTHSLGAKTGLILGIPFRALKTQKIDNWSLRGSTLKAALEEERDGGRIPFMLIATLGSTSTGAIDNIAEITAVAANYPELFIHVDAAWAGVSLACPEYRAELFLDAINARSKSINLGLGIGSAGEVHSFCTNLHKAGLVTFDASCLWVRDRTSLTDALDITPAYLRNSNSDAGAVVDYRNWQLPLGRRFRSLKIYFMLRSFGVAGFQKHQRRLVDLGAEFESLVLGNPAHFELFTPRSLSLVVFRLIFDKPSFPSEEQEIKIDSLNREFFARIIKREDMHVTATVVAGCYCIRVAIGSPFTRSVHVNTVWDIIQEIAEQARAHLVTE